MHLPECQKIIGRRQDFISRVIFNTPSEDTFDEVFREAVQAHMATHGFRAVGRGYQSDQLRWPVVIKTDKGTWRPEVYVYIALPSFGSGTQFLIGTPFFYSTLGFPKHGNAQLFDEYLSQVSKIFPHLFKALEEGGRAGEEMLLRFAK